MGFLMGLITGPRNTACPDGASGLARLNYAVQAVLYHEAAIAVTGFAIWVATAEGANHVGLETFCLLWVMRLSAKINVFLGVPNITEEFLPPHLRYLKSYFRIRPMNAAFPISITATTLLAWMFIRQAMAPSGTAFEETAAALLATLTVLALVEHWFMVLPIPAAALWQWGLVSHVAHAVPVPKGDGDEPLTSSMVAVREGFTPVLAKPDVVANPAATIVPFPTVTPATHRRRS
jgi:putative photosynthetic complex assembly protein 2